MIVNLTQHPATQDQVASGVVDLPSEARECLRELLTFRTLPGHDEILARAEDIAYLAILNDLGGDDDDDPFPGCAMIGGALWLMCPLANALRAVGVRPVFSFSVRETEEQQQPDGSVRKVAVFRHAGFVEAA